MADPSTLEVVASLDQGCTLPYRWYAEPAVFRAEQDRIFRSTWQYAGPEENVAEAGDFITVELGGVPVVVVRGADGELRGFVNVCRHRGSVLVSDESGRRKSFQCGYHGWTYGLDGRLLAAPGSKLEAEFDPSEFGLRAVQVARLGPFLFVNPDLEAPPFATIVGKLPEQIRSTGLDFGGIRPRFRRTFEIRANWKVVVDNYLECYHCPIAHPSFCDLIDVRDYTVTEFDFFSTQTAPAREKPGTELKPDEVAGGFYAYVWPNFSINIYPGPGKVSLNLFVPIAVDRTLAVFDYCFADEVNESEADEFASFVDQVQREDTALCESVQRGLESGIFSRGRLILSHERGIRHFQRLVARALDGPAD